MVNDSLLRATYFNVKICCSNIENSISYNEAYTYRNKALDHISVYYNKTYSELAYERYCYFRKIILTAYFDKIIPTP